MPPWTAPTEIWLLATYPQLLLSKRPEARGSETSVQHEEIRAGLGYQNGKKNTSVSQDVACCLEGSTKHKENAYASQ